MTGAQRKAAHGGGWRGTRRAALRGAAAGSLAGLLAAGGGGCAGGSSASGAGGRSRRSIAGGFVDDAVEIGHALRDGSLATGAAATERRCRVLVIGGGVAGLSAAWRLRRAGVDGVTVVELGSGVGGTSRGGSMASSQQADGSGAALRCPFGAHYLPQPRAEQRALAALLTDAGIASGAVENGRLVVPDRLLVRDPAERVAGLGFFEEGLWLRAGATAADESELSAFEAKIEELIRVDDRGRRLFDLPIAKSSSAMRDLDALSAEEWMAAEGLVSERVRWYLEYATRDDFGAALADTSAWALLHYFAARADLSTKESAEYLTWPEGNARLVQHLGELGGDEVRSSEVCLSVQPKAGAPSALTVAVGTGELTRWTADAIVVATPQFVTRRLLVEDPAGDARARFRYSPWLVANLHLERRPTNRGFPYAWDSVLHGSPSLGYVDACHQLDRANEKDTVWTWYLPITDRDERAARAALLARPWDTWRDAVLRDLRVAHPDIDDVVTRIDVWRWGHAMVKPTPGTLWGGQRAAATQPYGGVHFAHSDLSGIALFEEANWQGTRAAEEVLASLGALDETLL